MFAGEATEAAVAPVRVFDREPEADHRFGLGAEVGRILVAHHLAADAGLLEDVHRLQQLRVGEADAIGHRPQRRAARERVEHRVEVVHPMAELVDGARQRHLQGAIGTERAFFKKHADAVRRRLEVGVFGVALVACREHGTGGVRRMLGDERERASAQAVAGIGAREALDHEHAVALVGGAGERVEAHGGIEAATMDHGTGPIG